MCWLALIATLGLSGCQSRNVCTTEKDGKQYSMALDEALSIAKQSDYAKLGTLSTNETDYVCNAGTGTWWLNLKVPSKPNCNPAIVVGIADKKAIELNYRCTGLVACTDEAKLCPDGSYVGRQAPDCEFAACPALDCSKPCPPIPPLFPGWCDGGTVIDHGKNACGCVLPQTCEFPTPAGNCSGGCPQYMPPAPGWCSDGTVTPQGKDECGCPLPPACVKPDATKPAACDMTFNGTGAYMPNPAAVYCGRIGGTSTIKTAADGGQAGFCTLNGSEIDEWELFRRDCGK